MEEYKTLFKSQLTALSPRNHNKLNRDRQRVARTKKREERFQSNRNMDISPTPIVKSTEILDENPPTANVNQENHNPQTSGTNNTPHYASRKETYLQRYIKWKAEHRPQGTMAKILKTQQQPETAEAEVFVQPKRRSLYIVVDSKTIKSSEIKRLPVSSPLKPMALAQPPAGKQAPATRETATTTAARITAAAVKPTLSTVTSAAPTVKFAAAAVQQKVATVKSTATAGKPTTATVKPTETVVKPASTAVKSAANAVKPAATAVKATTVLKPAAATVKPRTAAVPPAATTAIATKATVPPAAKPTESLAAGSNARPKTTTVKKLWQPAILKSATVPAPLAATVKPQLTVKKPLAKSSPAAATMQATKQLPSTAKKITRPANLMTQPFDKPAPKIVKPIRGRGAAGKFKTAEAKIQPKSRRSDAPSNLSMRMKVKKPAPCKSKQKLVEQRPNLRQELLDIAGEEQLPETPIDFTSFGSQLQSQATSTHCKANSSQDLLEMYKDMTKTSPVRVSDQPKGKGSSVKRQLIPAEQVEQPIKKFNFVRYSGVVLESPDSQVTLMPAASDCNTEDQTIVQQTPPQSTSSGPNYLSPFVSVSRGKVNSQTERKKRNSMYLQDEGKEQPETPVAVRRTLESVGYFRIQLDTEIKRLHSLCEEWSSYSAQHEDRLLETGGKDMIDAAIGQTKLLTSKKLMQFGSLIDRCEAGATGVGLRPNDGSEATKPVLAKDLEGWWDMMRLQSDNVDKRFDNLGRWKANDWQDPDAVAAPKPKAKLSKIRAKAKPAAKASSNLKNFLRKAYAEQKKTQADEQPLVENSQQNETPKRRTIVVRDRKSFSPARTVLRVSVGSGGRPSIGGGSRPSIGGNILLKSAIMAAAEQKRQQTPPPPTPSRMSILKTPGTKRRESVARGVLFSAKKKVRRFQFTFDEGNISGDEENLRGADKLEDCEEDMSIEKRASLNSQNNQASEGLPPPTPENPDVLRTCVLRNRKVKIRPSSEFM